MKNFLKIAVFQYGVPRLVIFMKKCESIEKMRLTFPKLLFLPASLVLFGCSGFQNLVQQEIKEIVSRNKITENKILTENHISELPMPVKKWLRNSGAIGKPFITAGKVSQAAKMKMKPGQQNWMEATATQYTTVENPAFIWFVDVRMNRLINFRGRDKYENGKGEMLIKMNSVITLVNEKGEKLDEGTLQRFLGEMVWFPSLAASPLITWEEIDENTAKATMTYKGTTGSGVFHFNANGDFVKFSTFRFMENKPNAKKYEWILNVFEYQSFDGIKVPTKLTATWKLEKDDWTWLKLEITDIKYNENVAF